MKKVLCLLAIAAFAVSFTACKKDYTCTCTYSGTTIKYEYTKVKKADAEDACAASQTAWKIVDSAATCKL